MRRTARRAAAEQDGGALEIEFEDDGLDEPEYTPAPGSRPRDLRPAALGALCAAVLGAALWAAHGAQHAPGASSAELLPSTHEYTPFLVNVGYQGSHLLSAAQRRIEVDLRVAPAEGAKVRIIDYYISENGVLARADPPPSMTPLPDAGMDVKLNLTVTDCAVVPIGESMSFVDVVADGPTGKMDRFTILGPRYSADLARLLTAVCPERHITADPVRNVQAPGTEDMPTRQPITAFELMSRP